MSWFGETFGDSLNSLKGQITKITKEVLADDEVGNSESREPEADLVRELQALCESKDLEIASLRGEFKKLQDQFKCQLDVLKNESKKDRIDCNNDAFNIEELKKELNAVRKERDHLNLCLDELQAEHQTNLNQVISIRDKYKSELEVLKKDFDAVKTNLDKTLNEQQSQDRSDEITLLNANVTKLQSQLEKERQKLNENLKIQKESESADKEKIERLLKDVETISKDKIEIEKIRERVQNENGNLKKVISEKEKENKEHEIKFKLLFNEKEELMKKCQNQELKLNDFIESDDKIQKKLTNLLQMLKVDNEKISKDPIDLINTMEKKLDEKYTELNENLKKSANYLELEVKKLKEENQNYQNKLKMSVESNKEMERKYQEEITFLKNSLSDMKTQEQDCINQSQTDDVKRLEQEIAQCMSLILTKNNEITDYAKSVNNLEQELKNLTASSAMTEQELSAIKQERKNLEEEITNLKNLILNMSTEKVLLEEKIRILESQGTSLDEINKELQMKTVGLEKQLAELTSSGEQVKMLQEELQKANGFKSDAEKALGNMQNENFHLKQELENMKAQVIIRESNLAELMKSNSYFQDEMNKLQAQNNELVNAEKELTKWKDLSINLQIQLEDLIAKKNDLENECLKLKVELETGLGAKNAEIEQLKSANTNLMKTYNNLHQQLESRLQAEQASVNESERRHQEDLILQLQDENSELKSRVQKFQEQMKIQMAQFQTPSAPKEDVQQHRRSKSAVDSEMPCIQKSDELGILKQTLQQEQAKYQLLQHQFQEISNKEANARKEFERLKQHLIEVEDHYTEEAVENEKVINDLKSKLVAAEEQLHNSSTLYTSLKVRDNQHLESLQSQIRMVTAQRDDLQAKLSAAEDEVQKHKASLMSLQLVLEQFQQDKDTEVEQTAIKYEKQLQSTNDRFRDLEMEIQGLKNQLAEAKNGLNAASRLGEQLEKKTRQAAEMEESVNKMKARVEELEKNLATANQANNGKIDKSLIKNLVAGYVLSANADRKSQVLKIMASVLDFDQDERNKMGVDASRSGWLSNILHPQGEGLPSGQSLSEAFIRFLENESRPQPQLKFIPEQLEANTPKTSRTSPKPSGRLSELMLPTFNSPQENDSSIILKNVLKHS